MAGLLDDLLGNLNSDQGLLGLAMLSAAAPKERRTTLGEGLMSGLSLVNQRKLQREEQAMRQAEMRMREQDFGLRQRQAGLQEQQIMQALEAQKRAQERDQQRQRYLGSVDPMQGPAMPVSMAGGMAAGLSPQEAAALMPPQQKAPEYKVVNGSLVKIAGDNVSEAFRAPEKPDLNSLIVQGPDGKPMLNQMLLDAKRQIARDGATQIGLPKIEVKTGEGLAAQVGPMMKDSKAQAEAGIRLVDSASRILDAAERGNIFAGPGANLLLKGAQVADVFGWGGKDVKEKIANTRNVVRGMAEQAVSARSQLGGQAQISNSEQELLNKATAGDIAELTAGEIVQIAQLNDRLGRQLHSNHQRQLSVMQQRPELQGVAQFYAVPDLPKARSSATVVRTGRDAQGRKVEQLSDGTIRYGKD